MNSVEQLLKSLKQVCSVTQTLLTVFSLRKGFITAHMVPNMDGSLTT